MGDQEKKTNPVPVTVQPVAYIDQIDTAINDTKEQEIIEESNSESNKDSNSNSTNDGIIESYDLASRLGRAAEAHEEQIVAQRAERDAASIIEIENMRVKQAEIMEAQRIESERRRAEIAEVERLAREEEDQMVLEQQREEGRRMEELMRRQEEYWTNKVAEERAAARKVNPSTVIEKSLDGIAEANNKKIENLGDMDEGDELEKLMGAMTKAEVKANDLGSVTTTTTATITDVNVATTTGKRKGVLPTLGATEISSPLVTQKTGVIRTADTATVTTARRTASVLSSPSRSLSSSKSTSNSNSGKKSPSPFVLEQTRKREELERHKLEQQEKLRSFSTPLPNVGTIGNSAVRPGGRAATKNRRQQKQKAVGVTPIPATDSRWSSTPTAKTGNGSDGGSNSSFKIDTRNARDAAAVEREWAEQSAEIMRERRAGDGKAATSRLSSPSSLSSRSSDLPVVSSSSSPSSPRSGSKRRMAKESSQAARNPLTKFLEWGSGVIEDKVKDGSNDGASNPVISAYDDKNRQVPSRSNAFVDDNEVAGVTDSRDRQTPSVEALADRRSAEIAISRQDMQERRQRREKQERDTSDSGGDKDRAMMFGINMDDFVTSPPPTPSPGDPSSPSSTTTSALRETKLDDPIRMQSPAASDSSSLGDKRLDSDGDDWDQTLIEKIEARKRAREDEENSDDTGNQKDKAKMWGIDIDSFL